MDRLLDLDRAALELERFRRVWSSVGLAVGELTWRDAAEPWSQTLHVDRGEVHDPDSVGVIVKAENAEGQIVLFRGGWADIVMGTGQGDPIIEAPSVPDVAAFTSLLSGFLPRFGLVARGPEERLPLYGLSGKWRGIRRGGGHATAGNPDVWDQWEARHELSDCEHDAIVVHTQRRAIHGGRPMVGPRVTASEHLIKSDAVFAAMLRAEGNRDPAGLNQKVKELYHASDKIANDDAAWHRAELSIDGRSAAAIETTWEDWWVVLHIGFGEVADVYAYGPPGTKPNPLALEQVTADAYPEPRAPWRRDPAR